MLTEISFLTMAFLIVVFLSILLGMAAMKRDGFLAFFVIVVLIINMIIFVSSMNKLHRYVIDTSDCVVKQ